MSGPYTLTAPGVDQFNATAMQLHNAATTGNGGQLVLSGKTARVTFALQSTGTTSGGAITLEEAYFDPAVLAGEDYTGTWSTIGTAISASTFTGGAQVIVHAIGSYWAVRARISSNITGGGSVSVWAWGN